MKLILKKVKVHNLKNVDLSLNTEELIVFTGVSGSGKSSLAFDTIYVEGKRRYIESLSHQAKRHLKELTKPDAEKIEGISPTIAIEQKVVSNNPRSTVATMTGIYDFLRVLYARVATPYCPVSHEPLSNQSREKIIRTIQSLQEGKKILILAPFVKNKKGELKDEIQDLLRKGFFRLRIDGEIIEVTGDTLLDRSKAHTVDIIIDRIVIKPSSYSQITESVTSALEIGKGCFSIVDFETNEEHSFSEFAYSKKSDLSYPPLEPSNFSFNHPLGMCSKCHGLGEMEEFDIERIIDPNLSISQDCCTIASPYETIYYKNVYDNLAKIYHFDIDAPWKKLSEEAKQVFLNGSEKKWLKMTFVHPVKKRRWTEYVQWRGVLFLAHERLREAKSDRYQKKMEEQMTKALCDQCHGSRLQPYPSAAKLDGKTIKDIVNMTIEDTLKFFSTIQLTPIENLIAKDLITEIHRRLVFLVDVGLSYLSLDRISPSLSGGESQRVRLASQIGSGLVGATYILDEPSIGLHSHDQQKLITTLKTLKEKGNTVIVVEHDVETMAAADTIVDIGPLAGKKGGEIIFQGSYYDLLKDPHSITGKYLSNRLSIPIPKNPRELSKNKLTIHQAEEHNLQKITLDIPLEGLICITGVSGSGKSSLITDILFPALSNVLQKSHIKVGKHKSISGIEHLDKIIAIDQSPIGKTPRSNLATYTKLLDDIRVVFSQLKESQIRGYTPGHFSFNVKEGSCSYCSGLGVIKIDMDFMEDQSSICFQCKGKRYDPEILSIKYKEKNIDDVLNMDVNEALEHFQAIPHIKRKLALLSKIGLDYLPIGQSSTTLSGGEAQRIKLAKELVRPSTHKTLYILDEPSTGLHFHDLSKLIAIMQELVDQKNSMIVIEHNLDIIKVCDWIIDLGPGAGKNGGKVIAEGTPGDICKAKTPTGKALKEYLEAKTLKKPKKSNESKKLLPIIIENCEQNNLKGVSFEIARQSITAFTGPSGSGKSSMAFDTLYAESQRRYIESLPSYVRQFLQMMPKAKVERIENLCPSIALEQKAKAQNPRSTLGTQTEIYDLFRILYTHMGVAFCPETGEKIQTISKEYVVNKLLSFEEKEKIHILAPISFYKNETFEQLQQRLLQLGYLRVRLNGTYFELDEKIEYFKHKKNELLLVIDRMVIKPDIEKRLFESIEKATQLSDGIVIVATEKEDFYFNLAFAVEKTGKSYPPITPQTFSFNSEQGMCLECQGLGFVFGADLEKIPDFNTKTIGKILQMVFDRKGSSIDLALEYFSHLEINPYCPIKKLSDKDKQLFLHGSKVSYETKNGFIFTWKGFLPVLAKAAKSGKGPISFFLRPFMKQHTCPSCKGARLNPLARNVKVNHVTLIELCAYPIEKTYAFIENLKQVPDFLKEVMEETLNRLRFLFEIGLGYLSLDRSAPTLSGGETQRVLLAKQLGSFLHSCLYILDEPTIGLHPHNSSLLISALKRLNQLNNTLVLVEHDPSILNQVDYIIDFGPGAGQMGGKITAQGTLEEIKNNPDSLTGAYLSGRKKILIPKKRRTSNQFLTIANATANNLKNLTLHIPTNLITCISGVSGSGKSTLLFQLIYPAIKESRFKEDVIELPHGTISGLSQFNDVTLIDQNPIGQNVRSDVSTYSETLPLIRTFFSTLPSAQVKGLQPRYFSFNHKKGMCQTCQGIGYKSIDLKFLPPVNITCEACKGFRLSPLSLEITYKGLNLGQILSLSVKEAQELFDPIHKIKKKLQTLESVGLGYLKLNQDTTTLSGGEAQRLKLAKELAKSSKKNTLYLIDEPTIGLHPDDVNKLLPIFHELADQKNTLIIIEHNLDILKNADYIIDLGPDAGERGGELICQGTPEEVAKHKTSYTAKYLKEVLKQ